MNIGDRFIIKSKTFIEKGFAPVGSILEITKVSKNEVEVFISPFISENDTRESITLKTTKTFVTSCSTKLN